MNELIRFDVQWAVRYVLCDVQQYRDVWVFSHPVYLQEHFT